MFHHQQSAVNYSGAAASLVRCWLLMVNHVVLSTVIQATDTSFQMRDTEHFDTASWDSDIWYWVTWYWILICTCVIQNLEHFDSAHTCPENAHKWCMMMPMQAACWPAATRITTISKMILTADTQMCDTEYIETEHTCPDIAHNWRIAMSMQAVWWPAATCTTTMKRYWMLIFKCVLSTLILGTETLSSVIWVF